MHLPTHLMISWIIAHRLPEQRDRRLVTWAGVAPDLDALVILGGIEAYGQWHQMFTHSALAAAILTTVWTLLAHNRWHVAILAFLTFHVHVLCDLLGSGRWGLSYWWPFYERQYKLPPQWSWHLASWQNTLITVIAIGAIACIGMVYRRTFVESFLPTRFDRNIVEALHKRFGK